MRFVTRSGWDAKPPKSAYSALGTVRGVVIHHGASPTPTDHGSCSDTVRAYQNTHLNHPTEPYIDIAYNFLVCPHGHVYEGRGWHRGGANGTTDANLAYIAVCFIGDGRGPISSEAVQAYRDIIGQVRARYPNARQIIPHRAITGSECPGDTLITLIEKGALNPAEPAPRPEPPEPYLVVYRIKRFGRRGRLIASARYGDGKADMLARRLDTLAKSEANARGLIVRRELHREPPG